MKTAVEAVFIGKDRQFNRRFLRMCGHYLVEPTACTPASGWEKGQVENQVGVVRERFFTPRLRVASYEELNAWLLDRCVAYAKAHKHPELADCTIWQAFEAERPQLVQITGPFDGFHATQASVSKTCRVRAVAHSPGPPASVGRFGESLDHLPRSQTETRRALGQTELRAIPEHTRRWPLGSAHDAAGTEQAMNPETIEPDFVDRNNLDRRSNALLCSAL